MHRCVPYWSSSSRQAAVEESLNEEMNFSQNSMQNQGLKIECKAP